MPHFNTLSEAVEYCYQQREIAEFMAMYEAETRDMWMDMHQETVDQGDSWDD